MPIGVATIYKAMFNSNKKIIGAYYEKKAEKFLIKNGLKLITRNYRCRLGEIDLIMMQALTLVFVEVRSRQNSNFGHALETVNINKQRKIINTALLFIQQHPDIYYQAIRFDVIGIKTKIRWIENAFTINN